MRSKTARGVLLLILTLCMGAGVLWLLQRDVGTVPDAGATEHADASLKLEPAQAAAGATTEDAETAAVRRADDLARADTEEDDRVTSQASEDDRDLMGYASLDDAPAWLAAQHLEAAVDLAREERGIHVSDDLVDLLIDGGSARVIVAQSHERPELESRLAGSRHGPARYFRYIPFAALEVGPEALLELVESDDILGIEVDRKNYPSLMQSVPLISGDVAQGNGHDGTGLVIAVLDTGVETSHSAFTGRVVGEACFSIQGDCPGGGTEEFGTGSGIPCTFNCGHGTTVAGIALGLDGGGGGRNGVAIDAGLFSVQVFSEDPDDPGEPVAYTVDIISGLEYVYSQRFAHNFASVNMSLGGGGYNSTADCDVDNAARKVVIDLLRGINVPSVVSSGNDGFTDLISAPACISSAISVGSTTKSDVVSGFSNSAFFLSLLAPGENIETAHPGDTYNVISGTSMSAPHVAGAWASLLEAVPGKNVAEVLTALASTGAPITDLRNGITKPRINVAAAITALPDIDMVDGFDPEAVEGPQFVPPPALPNGACGLVGLELLLVAGAVQWAARRRRAQR